MNNSDLNTRHGGEVPQAPAKLVAALKELPPRRVFVPPGVDDAVLAAARRQFAPRPRTGWRGFRSWLAWPAAATACVVLAGLGYSLLRESAASRFAREDINRDGRVDILDAFALARELKASIRLPPALDLNGDGVVDERDVQRIAAQAVNLEKGGRT